MKKVLLLLTLSVLILSSTDAQIIYKKKNPVSTALNLSDPVKFDLPDFNVNLKSSDTKEEGEQFALPYDVQLDLHNSGTWYTLPNGDRIWKLLVTSTAARNLNIEFDRFYLPEGAEFYVYSNDRDDVRGAFTSQNNREDGKFAVYLVKGEEMMLEYVEPASEAGRGEISIQRIHHGFKGPLDFGTSGSCNNNVNCPEGAQWVDEIRASAMIIAGGVNGVRWCSGSMVNNTRQDAAPYFLTANHCLTGSAANWAFVFNYQSPNCTNIDGPLTDFVLGGQIVANNGPSDFALILLDDAPPVNYNVYHAGWDANDTPGDSSVGIHHPDGDIKKISFDYNPYSSSSYGSGTNSHWQIADWDDGTTEPGSSGSPLFNWEKHIVGQLHGGGAACGNNLSDYYGKFAYSWNTGSTPATRIKDWLDPDNTGALVLDGADFNTPATSLDAVAIDISKLAAEYCDTNITSLELLFRNMGADTITTANISILLDDNLIQTINWTGSLSFTQSFYQALTDFSVTVGTHELTAIISNPNLSTVDSNVINDTIRKQFEAKNGYGFEAQVITDVFGDETSYRLQDANSVTVSSQNGFPDNTSTTVDACLSVGCYTFILRDDASDGISNGGASLAVNGVSFGFLDGEDFQSSDTLLFCICDDGSVMANVEQTDCKLEEDGLGQEISSFGFVIFPNPTTGVFTVQTDRYLESSSLHVYNALGALVHEQQLIQKATTIALSMDKGIYTVQLRSDNGTVSTQKLIIR